MGIGDGFLGREVKVVFNWVFAKLAGANLDVDAEGAAFLIVVDEDGVPTALDTFGRAMVDVGRRPFCRGGIFTSFEPARFFFPLSAKSSSALISAIVLSYLIFAAL